MTSKRKNFKQKILEYINTHDNYLRASSIALGVGCSTATARKWLDELYIEEKISCKFSAWTYGSHYWMNLKTSNEIRTWNEQMRKIHR